MSDHLLARRPGRFIRLVAARLAHARRRRPLGPDQRRSHTPRSEDDGRLRRSDHSRHEQPRSVRDGIRAWSGQEGCEHPLGGIGRRARQRHPRRRQDLDERDAKGHAGSRARQHHRCVRVRFRGGICRSQEAAAERLRAIHISHARLRPHMDEDRRGPALRRLRARRSRRSDAPRDAVCRNPARFLHFV